MSVVELAARAAAAFAAGAIWWTLWEYLLHRFAFHLPRGRWFGSREHLNHHVHAGWAMDWRMWALWVGVAASGVGWGWLAGDLTDCLCAGVGFGVGWSIAYYFYEWQHRSAHLYPPRGSWQRRLRRHHFHHHFGHPMANQGVTVTWWDVVFRTLEAPDRVAVPRRLAMPWLLDDHGELKPEFEHDYRLVGVTGPRPSAAGDSEDKRRAYRNEAPLVGPSSSPVS